MSRLFLGLDIGGTTAKTGLVTETGEILSSSSCPVNFDHYKTPLIDTVVRHAGYFLQNCQVDSSMIEGIGVSATGQIDKNGVVIGAAGHIDGWIGTDIAGIFQSRFHRPVMVANDANCALLGEQWLGNARGDYKNVVMITIGTGIGGAVLVEGKLLEGIGGIAGELGHISIKKDGVLCFCGNNGCYEQYASVQALVNNVGEKREGLDLKEDDFPLNGALIFREIEKGNDRLRELVDLWMDDVCCGLVGFVHIFNPELLIIGGGISEQKELFISPLEKKIRRKIMPSFNKKLDIVSAKLGNAAGMLGAVHLIAESLRNMEFEGLRAI